MKKACLSLFLTRTSKLTTSNSLICIFIFFGIFYKRLNIAGDNCCVCRVSIHFFLPLRSMHSCTYVCAYRVLPNHSLGWKRIDGMMDGEEYLVIGTRQAHSKIPPSSIQHATCDAQGRPNPSMLEPTPPYT